MTSTDTATDAPADDVTAPRTRLELDAYNITVGAAITSPLLGDPDTVWICVKSYLFQDHNHVLLRRAGAGADDVDSVRTFPFYLTDTVQLCGLVRAAVNPADNNWGVTN